MLPLLGNDASQTKGDGVDGWCRGDIVVKSNLVRFGDVLFEQPLRHDSPAAEAVPPFWGVVGVSLVNLAIVVS